MGGTHQAIFTGIRPFGGEARGVDAHVDGIQACGVRQGRAICEDEPRRDMVSTLEQALETEGARGVCLGHLNAIQIIANMKGLCRDDPIVDLYLHIHIPAAAICVPRGVVSGTDDGDAGVSSVARDGFADAVAIDARVLRGAVVTIVARRVFGDVIASASRKTRVLSTGVAIIAIQCLGGHAVSRGTHGRYGTDVVGLAGLTVFIAAVGQEFMVTSCRSAATVHCAGIVIITLPIFDAWNAGLVLAMPP